MQREFIPVANPKLRFLKKKNEILKLTSKVISDGFYILGNEVASFENEFAQYIGVKYCVGVANGTDAIAIGLRAIGIKPGDEVITVSHTAVATIAAIEMIGAVPVFADIEIESRCIETKNLSKLITSKTKAIIPVHIYGQPANIKAVMDIARSKGIKVLEDCAQAHGAKVGSIKVGSFGDVSAFSFYPTKNLGAIGDGGAVVTDSHEVYENLLALRQYGWHKRYISDIQGVNSRLDELHAAFLRMKLRELDDDNNRRHEIANKFSEAFRNLKIGVPHPIADTFHVYHLYVIETDDRDNLAKFLANKGIGTALHYPMPVHLQPAYLNRIRGSENLTNTEDLYKKILSLPMYPELSDHDVDYIISSVQEYFYNQNNKV